MIVVVFCLPGVCCLLGIYIASFSLVLMFCVAYLVGGVCCSFVFSFDRCGVVSFA